MNYTALNVKIKALKNSENLISLITFNPGLKPFLQTYIEENLPKRLKLIKNKDIYLKRAIEKEIEIKNNNYIYLIKKYCDLEKHEYEDYLIKSKKPITEERNFDVVNRLYKKAASKKPNSLAPLAYFLWRNYGRKNEESNSSLS